MSEPDPWTRRLLAGYIRQPQEVRIPYQQDRDRVLYSPAFRRLGGITQVSSATELHLFHNRLTHSLKVAQIGRRLAESLAKRYFSKDPELAAGFRIDPNLVETAGLAHDLGHPPFGHVTDEVLNELVGKDLGGYEGNAQTFRIVTKLAIKKPPSGVPTVKEGSSLHGLDLTRGSLDAILKYPAVIGTEIQPADFTNRSMAKKCGVYPSDVGRFAFARNDNVSGTLSAAAILMDWADDVSYALHDIEDYVRAGIVELSKSRIERDGGRLISRVIRRLSDKNTSYSETGVAEALEDLLHRQVLPEDYHGSLENEYSLQSWVTANITRCEEAVSIENDKIVIDPDAQYLVEVLKAITWEYVIDCPPLAAAQEGQRRIITKLFEYLMEWVDSRRETAPIALQQGMTRIAEETKGMAESQRTDYLGRRGVADFIASLTDTQAMDLYKRMGGGTGDAVFSVWLFDTYATGDWSISQLTEELNRRGMRSRPTATFVGTPLTRSQVHRILSSPYYIGKVVYGGAIYDGMVRRQLNQAFYSHLFLGKDGAITRSVLNPAFAVLRDLGRELITLRNDGFEPDGSAPDEHSSAAEREQYTDQPEAPQSPHGNRAKVRRRQLCVVGSNLDYLAEGVGFEPTAPLRARQFSRLLPSTTRSPFRVTDGLYHYPRCTDSYD